MLAKITAALIFYMFYWLCCFFGTGTDKKNLAGLRSYPEAVQRAVREHTELGKVAPREESVSAVLFGNILLFTVVFSVLGVIMKKSLGLNDFWTAFAFLLTLGEGLGAFDLVIIDLLWWRSTKRIRFSFLPEREHYQDPTKHINSFLRGIPMFCAVAVLSAAIVNVLG